MKTRLLLACPLIAGSLLAGCLGDLKSDGGVDLASPPDLATPLGGPGSPGSPCKVACDCMPGLACPGGRCTPGPQGPVYCCGALVCPPQAMCEDPTGVRRFCLGGGLPDGGMPPRDDMAIRPPPPGDLGPPPDGAAPPDQGAPPDGGMGPRPCKIEADCANACPPQSLGCTCASTPKGLLCAPTCKLNGDCPQPPGMPPMSCHAGICGP